MSDGAMGTAGKGALEAMAHMAAAGKLHILDLDEIKERLGGRWQQLSEPVHAYFEKRIKDELGPGDFFLKLGELSYVIVFKSLSVEESQLKCLRLSLEISKRLFGENGLEAAVRNVLGQVDLKKIAAAPNRAAALDHIIELEGKEEIVGKRLMPDPSTFFVEEQIAVHYDLNPETEHVADVKNLAFAYHPIWDVRRQIVLLYLCQPVPGEIEGAARLKQEGFLTADEEEAQAAIDTLTLRECCRRIVSLAEGRRRLLLACPVHFSTISRSRHWNEYAKLCKAVPSYVAKDLVFVVHGLDSGVPHIRLGQELPKLRASCRQILCALRSADGAVGVFSGIGCDGVGLVVEARSPRQSEKGTVQIMRRFVQGTDGQAIERFALGLGTKSLVINAMALGIRYVQGPAVGAASPDPDRAYVFELADLYETGPRAPTSHPPSAA